mmetsp:Transcript_10098/g.29632  ORF Transcript_10098/g.29632 Transcript_10098/m.29632 type:complete len:216 (-) Transcript_10098:487-1134(-)
MRALATKLARHAEHDRRALVRGVECLGQFLALVTEVQRLRLLSRGTTSAASPEGLQGSARGGRPSTGEGVAPSLMLRVAFASSRGRLCFGLVTLFITPFQHFEGKELVELLAVKHASFVICTIVGPVKLQERAGLRVQPAHVQRHVPIQPPHELALPASRPLDPPQERLGVLERRRESHELNRRRHVHQRLLPDRAPVHVIYIMDLVGDDAAQAL